MFNMSFIINNVKAWKEEDKKKSLDEYYEKKLTSEMRRDYDRLYKVINFLEDFKCTFVGNNQIFLVNNLLSEKREKMGYQFTTESMIFHICLCENFKLKFFKNFRKKKYSSKAEYNEWSNSMFKSLDELKGLYEKNSPKYSWEIFKINTDSIINEFESINDKLINIEKQIFDIILKFISLPDDDKKEVYYNHIRSRFKYMDKVIDKKIKELDEDRYNFFERQFDYNKKMSESKFKYNDKMSLTENMIEIFKEFNLNIDPME